MAIVNNVSSILHTGRSNAGWQPKASKIRVGRDVGALTATTFTGSTLHNTVIGNGDDVALKSKDLFDKVRSAAQRGFGVRQFRSINDKEMKDGKVRSSSSVEIGDYSVTVSDGTLSVYKKPEKVGDPWDLVMRTEITEDSRLVWNEKGEPELLTGNAVHTRGVLQAQSANEILLSVSGSDVVAGEGTVVWNLSGKTGTYSGGNNVTYLGTYEGGNFTDTEGKVTFGGYFNRSSFSNLSLSEFSGVFDEASVTLEKGHGTFSGYFSASEIIGATTNKMSGMFLNACSVRGGEGDDNFSGRFIDSDVEAGEGNNSFGYGSIGRARTLAGSRSINGKDYPQEYAGIEADFINAVVTAGSGKDRVTGVAWDSSFDLGQGDDSTDGIFSDTEINGGGGNDTLQAEFAVRSTFTAGDGDDSVTLKTALFNTITTGGGANTITMGLNNDDTPSPTTWQTRDEYFSRTRPRETGELAGNTVDASRGESALTVNNGETSRRVTVRNRYAEGDSEAEKSETTKAVAAATPEEQLPPAIPKTVSAAIGKYHEALGMEPQSRGATAVTIEYGDGSEESFMSAERKAAKSNKPEAGMMIRAVRRYTSEGTVSWERWQRLED